MKKTLVTFAVLIIIGVGAYFLLSGLQKGGEVIQPTPTPIQTVQPTPTPSPKAGNLGQTVIGKSVQGRDIVAYHYGKSEKEILFVAGVHGGYAWNAVLLNYEIMDYLEKNPSAIPGNVKVTVIPVLNPDGLYKVTAIAGRFTPADVSSSQIVQISGRFNANLVDLNRNFDCDWKAAGVWQNKTVSGGSKAFSEPESLAIKNYVEAKKPVAVIVWDSAAGGVFSSNCGSGILPETQTINGVYAKASGYPSYENFDFYELTGDMINWLAKNKIPAISVLLSDHETTELDKNLAGIKAILEHYAK